MTIKELKQSLAAYPDDMPVKLNLYGGFDIKNAVDFTEENYILYSETAFVNDAASEEEWDCEDGKFELGDGPQYLLINAPVY